MLENSFVFGVDKYERFIAAKLLLESFLANGLCLDHPDFARDDDPAKDLHTVGTKLNRGLEKPFREEYGLKLENGRWTPKSLEELRTEARQLGKILGVIE